MKSELTGKIRYRRGWFGVLILQVEEIQYRYENNVDRVEFRGAYQVWRDAGTEDLTNPALWNVLAIP